MKPSAVDAIRCFSIFCKTHRINTDHFNDMIDNYMLDMIDSVYPCVLDDKCSVYL